MRRLRFLLALAFHNDMRHVACEVQAHLVYMADLTARDDAWSGCPRMAGYVSWARAHV